MSALRSLARLPAGRRHLPSPSTGTRRNDPVRTELDDLRKTTDADTTRLNRAESAF
jgi:hypothetical protein